ncbi:MAG: type IV pilin N-terminal domain-containing protein, partial [Candidatus Micrarchaeota archaeon]
MLRKLFNNNYAVSPVIGEILLIAIVVILGAIIASYAFGTTKPLQDNLLIGMSVDKINEDNIVVTFMGGRDA